MKKWWGITLLVLVIMGTGVGIYLKKMQIPPIHPVKGDIVESVYGIGLIKSHQRFHAKIAVTSVLENLFVKEGDKISKGQKLFKIAQGPVIVSPIEGTVTIINANQGEMIFPQTDILIVQNLDDRYVEVSLEQQGAVRLRPNLLATISFDTLSSAVVKGEITAILPQTDKFLVHVDSKDLPETILPGMSVDVTFDIATKKDVILIPLKAVMNGQVMIKRQGKKMRLPVETGLRDGARVEILSPELFLDDEILVSH